MLKAFVLASGSSGHRPQNLLTPTAGVAASISGLGEAIMRAALARSCGAELQQRADEAPADVCAQLLERHMMPVGAGGRAPAPCKSVVGNSDGQE